MKNAALKGIGRARKARCEFGEQFAFSARDGTQMSVYRDSDGYHYAHEDGLQILDTAYGYAFSIEGALRKATA